MAELFVFIKFVLANPPIHEIFVELFACSVPPEPGLYTHDCPHANVEASVVVLCLNSCDFLVVATVAAAAVRSHRN